MPTAVSPAVDTLCSSKEQAEVRRLIPQVLSTKQWSMSTLAETLGFGDASPLHKLLREPKRRTTRARLEQLRQLTGLGTATAGAVRTPAPAGAAATATATKPTPTKSSAAKGATTKAPSAKSATKPGTKMPAKGATKTAPKPAAQPVTPPSANGHGASGSALVSAAETKQFERTVREVAGPGKAYTVERLAQKLGYQHTSSLYKAIRRQRVPRDRFNSLMQLAKGGATSAGSQPAPTRVQAVATPATGGASSSAARSGVSARLQSALTHLQRARRELEQASSANALLAPGLKGIVDQLGTIEAALEF